MTARKFAVKDFVINHQDILLMLLLSALAAGLRFYRLASWPSGLHGDEAIAGMEGQRILREGFIGPYSLPAMGQPSGPMYLNALSILCFGNTVLATRFVPACLGTLTVPVLYSLLKKNISRIGATSGAFLLATSAWHLHLSRTGFPVAAWPFLVVVALWTLFKAIETRSRTWWSLAGGACGLGVYTYNAHPLFIAIELLFLGFMFVRRRRSKGQRGDRSGGLAHILSFLGALFLVSLPMLCYVLHPGNAYFGHVQTVSIFRTPEWAQQAEWYQKIGFITARYFMFWKQLVVPARLDGGDGTGLYPLLNVGFALLAAIGAIVGCWRKNLLVMFLLMVALLAPLGVVMTNDGAARRTLILVMALATFGGVAVHEFIRFVGSQGRRMYRCIALVMIVWINAIAANDLWDYFSYVTSSPAMQGVYSADLIPIIRFMSSRPQPTHFYFASDRWPFNYESRQFLAPQLKGDDISSKYCKTTPLFASHDRSIFVLVDIHLNQLAEIQRRYGKGRVWYGKSLQAGGQTPFIAYQPDSMKENAPIFALSAK